MTRTEASALVTYIGKHSTRFSASTIDFADRTWVLLRDCRAARTAPCEEPILDVSTYLLRQDRCTPLNPELRALLESWLEMSQTTIPSSAAPLSVPPAVPRPSVSRTAGHGATAALSE